jgi:hypothetical protein
MWYGVALAETLLLTNVAAFQQVRVRGTVRESKSGRPIPRATVTASGNQSQQDELTDDQGFFRLVLQGVAPGSLVRIRVQKEGYAPYDRQIAVSEEIPLEVLMSLAPARSRAEPASTSPVEQRLLQQLNNVDPEIRASAIASLRKQPRLSDVTTAAIIRAVLDEDLEVQAEAVIAVWQSKISSPAAVQNLIVALKDDHDSRSGARLRSLAATTLGDIGPNAKSAIPTLLTTLKDSFVGPAEDAALALIKLGVQDRRVDAELLEGMNDGGANDVRDALVKMGPSGARFIPGLIGILRAKLQDANGDQGSQSHVDIIRVLEAIGPAGDTALEQLMESLNPNNQAQLALAWVEMNPAAKSAIRRTFKIPEVSATLAQKLSRERTADLSLSGKLLISDDYNGVALRSAVGMLLLDLEPKEEAWQVLMKALSAEISSYGSAKVAYAGFYISELDPASARRSVPALVKAFEQCSAKCDKNSDGATLVGFWRRRSGG